MHPRFGAANPKTIIRPIRITRRQDVNVEQFVRDFPLGGARSWSLSNRGHQSITVRLDTPIVSPPCIIPDFREETHRNILPRTLQRPQWQRLPEPGDQKREGVCDETHDERPTAAGDSERRCGGRAGRSAFPAPRPCRRRRCGRSRRLSRACRIVPRQDEPCRAIARSNDHGHDQDEGRHRDLLQGLGHRSADRLPSRLAAERGRLGCADDVLPRARLSRDRA